MAGTGPRQSKVHSKPVNVIKSYWTEALSKIMDDGYDPVGNSVD